MFLNLKNKKVVDAALNNHIKATQCSKTYRQDVVQRLSKESIGHQTNRNTNNHQFHKKTAYNHTSINQHQTHKTKQSSQSLQNVSKSNIRGQKIVNAYKKLKTYDVVDKSRLSQQSMSLQKQKNQRSIKQFSKNNLHKKQIIKNFTNNYIMISQNSKDIDKNEQHEQQKSTNISIKDILQILLCIFNQQTNKDMQETVGLKAKSISSRQSQFKNSLQRTTSKLHTKKSNKNLIYLNHQSKTKTNQQNKSIYHQSISIFQKNVDQFKSIIQSEIKSSRNEDKQLLQLVKRIANQMNNFTISLYEELINETQFLLKKYQKNINQVCNYTKEIQSKYQNMQKQMDTIKSYTSNLQTIVNQMIDKNHYAAYFLGEISYQFDVDTFLRQKIVQCYQQNCNSRDTSQIQYNDNNIMKKGSLKLNLGNFAAKKIQNQDQFLYKQVKSSNLKK